MCGVKLTERGARHRNAMANAAQMSPIVTDATRQSYEPATNDDMTRPPMPPMALPAMYRPTILFLFLGLTSSVIYATDTDVAPESTKPFMADSATTVKNVVANDAAMQAMAETSSAVHIRAFLGNLSAANIATTNPPTMPRVENDTVRLLTDADRVKHSERSGSNGWK